jgi:hypothetical protein
MNDKTFKLKPLTLLIDADKFFLDECQRCGSYPYIQSNPFNKESLRERLDKAPKVDAKPIVHAHWIEKTDWYFGIGRIHCTCSNCGYTVDYKPGSRGDGRGGKFCDDCGAIMDLKDGESEYSEG